MKGGDTIVLSMSDMCLVYQTRYIAQIVMRSLNKRRPVLILTIFHLYEIDGRK